MKWSHVSRITIAVEITQVQPRVRDLVAHLRFRFVLQLGRVTSYADVRIASKMDVNKAVTLYGLRRATYCVASE